MFFVDILSFPIFYLIWLIVKSNLVPRTILMVFILVMSHLSTSSCLWSNQQLCFVHATYEFIFLECLDKFVAEPIDDILTFSMLDLIHMEHLALMLETFENLLHVISKYEFWMLEVTFSGSR